MTYKEKVLYHQIQPAKLLTDWLIGGLIAYVLLWQHHLWLGLAVALVPSVIVSFIVLTYVDLQKYKDSSFGHYIKKNMTPAMQAVRLLGAIVAGLGAWYQMPLMIIFGVVVVLLGWFKGLI